jgi:Fe2+ transport system protein FeoA
MLRSLLNFWRRRPPALAERCSACPLAACARGARCAVLKMECDGEEARRLRHLGLYEGSYVTVVDRQGGCLLEVSGARLALGAALAASITVLPFQS